MLAILYIAAMIYFGDCLCRRFYRFSSLQHRFATAFLVGLLFGSALTYLGALAFHRTGQPLLAGNLIFLLLVLAAAKIPRRLLAERFNSQIERPPGSQNLDWLCLGICLLFGWWLMLATLNYQDGSFQFAIKSWSDFGANLSLAQSFALGDNFPSEHPFFPGEPLRYHFLFWFQSANLSFLGLNLVWAINLLSLFSLLALLILIMTFTEMLFGSRVAGRLAVILFFFPATSLAYLLFFQNQESFGDAINTLFRSTRFLATGYPFRGDDWGALTVAVFVNQRQLISGTGILFIVLIFLVDFYRRQPSAETVEPLSKDGVKNSLTESSQNRREIVEETAPPQRIKMIHTARRENFSEEIQSWLFSGLLIGVLPYWNSAVFVAAVVLFGSILFFLPFRRYLIFLIGMIVAVGLPQILLLRSGNLAPTTYSLFHWGFTIPEPTVPLVAEYLAWTFGFKWILLLIAVWFSSGLQRRLLLAFSSLLAVVFLFQLSTDAFNNHKLLNIWNVFAAVYAAYALWRIGKNSIAGMLLAVFLALAMVFTSVADFFPIYNDADIVVKYENDRLTTWILENTQPDDIFLTQTLLSHPILFTGRRVFLANTLYAWTAGYNVGARETIYKRLFQETDANVLMRLLHENKIAYVAIDDGVRRNDLLQGNVNEIIYQSNFEKVFEDTERKYDNVVIYRVAPPTVGENAAMPQQFFSRVF